MALSKLKRMLTGDKAVPTTRARTDSLLLNCGVDGEVVRAAIRRLLLRVLSNQGQSALVGQSSLIDELVGEHPELAAIPRLPLASLIDPSTDAFNDLIVIEEFPAPDAWPIIATAAAKPGVRLLWEAVREDLLVGYLASKVPYLVRPEQILDIYRSEPGTSPTRLDHPIANANRLVPFRGKRVIELGPLDAAQTSAILKLGASELVCIEIRPDNYVKTLLAADLLGARNLTLKLENFHATTAARHGHFDVCIAHGVYYHSNAPFQLLENIAGLAPVIVFGGFCATDEKPHWDWLELEHEGHRYRAKNYYEVDYFTAGVSTGAYFFSVDAVQDWFRRRGFELLNLSVEDSRAHGPSGAYLSFVAKRLNAR